MCGKGWRSVPGSTRPLPVPSKAGSLPSLGLQWRRSSAPGTPQPRPRLLLPAQQLLPPRPFSPHTPTPWLAACACADPSSPPLSQQKPCPPGPQRAGDSPGGRARWGGRCFFLPARFPFPPPPLTAGATSHPVVQFNPPNHLPSVPPTFAALPSTFPLSSSSALWNPLCTRSPCVIPRSQVQRSLATREMQTEDAGSLCVPLHWVHLCGLQAPWGHLLPQSLFMQLVHHSQILAAACLPLTAALGGRCQHPHSTSQEAEAQTHCMD